MGRRRYLAFAIGVQAQDIHANAHQAQRQNALLFARKAFPVLQLPFERGVLKEDQVTANVALTVLSHFTQVVFVTKPSPDQRIDPIELQHPNSPVLRQKFQVQG